MSIDNSKVIHEGQSVRRLRFLRLELYIRQLFLLRGRMGRSAKGLRVTTNERQRAEESSARLAAIVESSDDAIISKDLEGRITSWNPGAERLLGYRAEEMIGQPITLLVPPDRQQEERDILLRISKGESVKHLETVRVAKGGRLVDVSLTISPIRESGQIIGAAKIVRDIAARKQAQEALRRSETKFRAVFQGAAVGVALVDMRGYFVDSNPKFQSMLGYSAQELRGLSVFELTHPDDRERDSAVFREKAAGKRDSYQIEKRYIRKDGAVIWGRLTASVFEDEGGQRLGIGMVEDITERKRFEESLQNSEERFRTMAEMVPDILFSCRADGSPVYSNLRFYEYTGLPAGSAMGYNWLQSVHPEDRERTETAWREALKAGTPIKNKHRMQASSGEFRWFLVRVRPIRDTKGHIVQWFGTCTDIDDQQRAEEALEEAVAQRTAKLVENIGELEHYSYSITHDLRAPLRGIHGFARKLLDNGAPNPDLLKECLERIITSVKRMDQLLQDTLNYGKILREELKLEPVDVRALLQGIIESYPDLQLPRAEVILESSFPLVFGNQAALTHCCSNLLDNAIKFVAPGTQPRVRVWAENRGQWVRVWFEDNGIGVPKEVQDRIFGMFQRLDKSYEGTGIGLAIVRKAVQRMGGKTGVESEPGQGSQFWLELKPANRGIGEKPNARFCNPLCGG